MAVELYNAVTTTDNIAFSEALVDGLTTTGQLLIFFGPTGGTVIGSVAILIAISFFRAASDLENRIAEELNRRNQKDPTTAAPEVVTLDPSKFINETLWVKVSLEIQGSVLESGQHCTLFEKLQEILQKKKYPKNGQTADKIDS